MPWLRRSRESATSRESVMGPTPAAPDPAMLLGDDPLLLDDPLHLDASICASCGRELDGDPDEDITGDAGMPICGDCARERDFFVMDIADGELDGEIE